MAELQGTSGRTGPSSSTRLPSGTPGAAAAAGGAGSSEDQASKLAAEEEQRRTVMIQILTTEARERRESFLSIFDPRPILHSHIDLIPMLFSVSDSARET